MPSHLRDLERSLGRYALWSPDLWVCDEVTGAGLGATAGHSAGRPTLLAFGCLLRIIAFSFFHEPKGHGTLTAETQPSLATLQITFVGHHGHGASIVFQDFGPTPVQFKPVETTDPLTGPVHVPEKRSIVDVRGSKTPPSEPNTPPSDHANATIFCTYVL